MINILFKILIIHILHFTLNANKIYEPVFNFKLDKLLYDSGESWNSLSLFGNKSFGSFFKKKVSFQNIPNFSFSLINNKISFSSTIMLNYKNNFYLYKNLFLKQKSQNVSFDFYSHNIIENNNFSEFGYENNWANIAICYGNEGWGSGNTINLAMNKYAKPYDYFKISSDYGNLRVKYIHGFLERTPDNINRYITARGLEWSNKNSLILGLSETTIYSGLNRPFDISYINPISSHLEIELNDRVNNIGASNGNAVWQFHSELLILKKIRFSFNFLFDEFVIDKNIQKNKEHGKAYSYRISYVASNEKNRIVTIYSKHIYVGTPTFRHSNGINNFVNNSSPLGWDKGSDAEEFLLGINYCNKSNFFLILESGLTQTGEENILNRSYDPYKDYLKGSFPSGKYEENIFFKTRIDWWVKGKNIFSITINDETKKKREFILSLNRRIF